MRVVKSGLIYTFGDIAVKIIPFLLLPYLTRMLGGDGYGELSYFQFYISFFSVVLGLTQGGVLTRYYFYYGHRSITLPLTCSYIYTFSLSIVLLFVFFFINQHLVIAIVVAISSELVASQLTLRICEKKTKQYVLMNMSLAISSMALTFITFELFSPSVELRLVSILAPNFILFFIASLMFRHGKKIRYNYDARLKGVKFLINTAIPLMLVQLTVVLKGQIDKVFIYHNYDKFELGVYSAASQLALPLSILILSFNKAFAPLFFEKLKNNAINNADVFKFLLYSILFIPCGYFISMLIPNDIFKFLIGIEYDNYSYFFSMFVLGYSTLPAYLIMTNYFVYIGKAKVVTISSFLGISVYILYLTIFSEKGIQYLPFGVFVSNLISIISLVLFYLSYKRQRSEKI